MGILPCAAQSAGAVVHTSTASLQSGKTTPNQCPWYDTKQSGGKVPVLQITPSLPLLPGQF